MAKKSDRFLQLGMKNELKKKLTLSHETKISYHGVTRKSSTMSAISQKQGQGYCSSFKNPSPTRKDTLISTIKKNQVEKLGKSFKE